MSLCFAVGNSNELFLLEKKLYLIIFNNPQTKTENIDFKKNEIDLPKEDNQISFKNRKDPFDPLNFIKYFNLIIFFWATLILLFLIQVTFPLIIFLRNYLANSYYQKGLSYILNLEYNKAISTINKALNFNPNYTVAYYLKCNLYFDRNDIHKAKKNYEKALNITHIHPTIPNVYNIYIRGLAHFKMSDKEKAKIDLEKVAQLCCEQKEINLYQKITDLLQSLD